MNNNNQKKETEAMQATVKALSNQLQFPRTPVSVTIKDLIAYTENTKEPLNEIARGARNPFEEKGKCDIL